MKSLFLTLLLAATSTISGAAPPPEASTPAPRHDAWWRDRHEAKKIEAANRADKIKLVFLGDSITHGWENAGREDWDARFAPMHALNLGYSGDRTQHVLWRIQNGEWPADLQPETAVIMIGTNNTGHNPAGPPADTAAAITLLCETILQRAPHTRIVLLAIFPRGESANHPLRLANDKVNAIIANLDSLENIDFHDISTVFLDDQGRLSKDIMPDFLHPNPQGYHLWARALTPILTKPTP